MEHLTVFIENKPGKLNRIMEYLADAKLNLRAYSLASAGAFGVLKLLLDKPAEANELLVGKGFVVTARPVLVAKVPDKPGALHNLLKILSDNKMNVTDSYGFLLPEKSAALVLECDDCVKAEVVLREHGIKFLSDLIHFEAK